MYLQIYSRYIILMQFRYNIIFFFRQIDEGMKKLVFDACLRFRKVALYRAYFKADIKSVYAT